MRPILALCLLGLSLPALAVDADPYRLSGSMAYGSGTLSVESPSLAEVPGFAGGFMGNVAEGLAIGRYADGTFASIVGTTLNTTFQGSWTLEDRARIDLFVPFYPYAEAPVLGYQGMAMGDVRLQALYPVFGKDGPFGGAVALDLGLPTGSADPFLTRGAHVAVKGILGGELTSGLGYAANAAVTLAPADSFQSVTVGNTMDLSVGAWYPVQEGLRLGGETVLSLGLASAADTTANHLGTANLFVQLLNPSGAAMTLGTGTGFISGVGSPDYRLFAGLTWAPLQSDKDGDGINDDLDACPQEAEDADGFDDLDGCPDLDNDMDGISDRGDACPDEAEDLDSFDDTDGCPDPDNDSDGVLDAADLCPNQAGALEGCPDTDGDGVSDLTDLCPEEAGDPTHNGCADSDSDGFLDAADACPQEPGPADELAGRADGCPKPVYLSAQGVVQPEGISFDEGVVRLSDAHKASLDLLATWLSGATYVVKLEVRGHTDNAETRAERVSSDRAEAAMSYLMSKGISEARLVSKGYAGMEPLGTNRTATGRAKNRRVDFAVLELEPLPEAAAPKQPVGAPSTLSVVLHGHGFAQVWIDDVQLATTAPFSNRPIGGGPHVIRVVNASDKLDVSHEINVVGEPVVVEIGDAPKVTTAEEAPWAMDPAEEAVETESLPWGDEGAPAEVVPTTPAAEGADPWAVPWLDGEAPTDAGASSDKKKKKRDR
ncbi:MAG: OmpA family protein [Deltaproteobacteria bacterium]|nr:OmpA family protein [Deltaproteobacteria bacterium]